MLPKCVHGLELHSKVWNEIWTFLLFSSTAFTVDDYFAKGESAVGTEFDHDVAAEFDPWTDKLLCGRHDVRAIRAQLGGPERVPSCRWRFVHHNNVEILQTIS